MMRMNCSGCGAPPSGRRCEYCGAVLLLTGDTLDGSAAGAKVTSSLERWRKEIKETPENGQAHYALGLCLLNMGLRDDALVALRKAVELVPESPEARYNLALACFNEGKEVLALELLEAERSIDAALKLDPEFSEAKAFRFFFRSRAMADRPLEVAELKKAIASSGDIAAFHSNLGLALLALGKTDEALASVDRALELEPERSVFLTNRCAALFRAKRYSDAVDAGEKAVSAIGSTTTPFARKQAALAYANLAEACAAAGQGKRVSVLVAQARSLDPSVKFTTNGCGIWIIGLIIVLGAVLFLVPLLRACR